MVVVTFEATVVSDEPRLEEAARTLPFAVVTFDATVVSDEPSDDEARSVWAFTALVIPDVWVLVFEFTLAVPAVIADASEVDAARTVLLVLLLTADVSEVTFAAVAREPDERVASVRLRVP